MDASIITTNSNTNDDVLTIFHFNDIYELESRKAEPVGGAARFAFLLKELRENGLGSPSLCLFSGDALNPSLLSTVTRGKHMIEVLNLLGVDCAALGNHDLDFGVATFQEIAAKNTFPWLLSNVKVKNTNTTTTTNEQPSSSPSTSSSSPLPCLGGGSEVYVVQVSPNWRVGFMGIWEYDCLATLATVDIDIIQFEDPIEAGKRLAHVLRDKEGEYKCDLVIALTHMRFPNDEKFASAVDGVDLLLGGHDHDPIMNLQDMMTTTTCGSSSSGGSTKMIKMPAIKSGSDFRYLTRIQLQRRQSENAAPLIEDIEPVILHPSSSSTTPTPAPTPLPLKSVLLGSTFLPSQKDIYLTARQFHISGNLPCDVAMEKVSAGFAEKLGKKLSSIIGLTRVPLDARFAMVRTRETAVGNFITDLMRQVTGSDAVVMNSGTMRADSILGPGLLRLRDLVSLLPMQDSVVTVAMSGALLLQVLENGVSQYPKLEGRFLQVSGLRFEYDPARESGKRITPGSVWILLSEARRKVLQEERQKRNEKVGEEEKEKKKKQHAEKQQSQPHHHHNHNHHHHHHHHHPQSSDSGGDGSSVPVERGDDTLVRGIEDAPSDSETEDDTEHHTDETGDRIPTHLVSSSSLSRHKAAPISSHSFVSSASSALTDSTLPSSFLSQRPTPTVHRSISEPVSLDDLENSTTDTVPHDESVILTTATTTTQHESGGVGLRAGGRVIALLRTQSDDAIAFKTSSILTDDTSTSSSSDAEKKNATTTTNTTTTTTPTRKLTLQGVDTHRRGSNSSGSGSGSDSSSSNNITPSFTPIDSVSSSSPGPGWDRLDPEATYIISAKSYLLHGKDGFEAFLHPSVKVLVDEEGGPILPSIVRNHFRVLAGLAGLGAAATKEVTKSPISGSGTTAATIGGLEPNNTSTTSLSPSRNPLGPSASSPASFSHEMMMIIPSKAATTTTAPSIGLSMKLYPKAATVRKVQSGLVPNFAASTSTSSSGAGEGHTSVIVMDAIEGSPSTNLSSSSSTSSDNNSHHHRHSMNVAFDSVADSPSILSSSSSPLSSSTRNITYDAKEVKEVDVDGVGVQLNLEDISGTTPTAPITINSSSNNINAAALSRVISHHEIFETEEAEKDRSLTAAGDGDVSYSSTSSSFVGQQQQQQASVLHEEGNEEVEEEDVGLSMNPSSSSSSSSLSSASSGPIAATAHFDHNQQPQLGGLATQQFPNAAARGSSTASTTTTSSSNARNDTSTARTKGLSSLSTLSASAIHPSTTTAAASNPRGVTKTSTIAPYQSLISSSSSSPHHHHHHLQSQQQQQLQLPVHRREVWSEARAGWRKHVARIRGEGSSIIPEATKFALAIAPVIDGRIGNIALL